MTALNKIVWNAIRCSKKELRLDISLKCGQSFRWKSLEFEENTVFIGVIKQNLLLFKQDDSFLHYCVVSGTMSEEAITDYFNLGVDLETLYTLWSKVDPIFNKISTDYPGVRMLRQDPVENLFAFICSANNNIQRISGMVENMAKHYGDKVAVFEDQDYYSFPHIHKLAQPGVETKLRELGFGYRAKYIEESAKKILDLGGEEWLLSLRKMDYNEAKQSLLQLSGIGPKVADCILLMSLDQPSSIPVDTHVFQIAQRYLPHLKANKTVTTKVYAEIGDYFRNLYGEYAGWAHSVLFSADLRHLQDLKTHTADDNEKDTKPKIKKEPKNGKKTSSKDSIKTEVKEEPNIKEDTNIKVEPVADIPEKAAKKRSKASRAVIDIDSGKAKKTKN